MPELCEGNIGAASEASPEYSSTSSSAPADSKLKRKASNARVSFIRDLQVHVPPSLTDTCQLQSLSRKRDGLSILGHELPVEGVPRERQLWRATGPSTNSF